ncbi:MAG: cytochrome c oxidase assembly protein [Inquilinaceae bacterium]
MDEPHTLPTLLPGIYCGPAPHPAELWSEWNFDPVLLLSLAALAVGLRRSPPGLVAVGVLAIAFVSPLCALSSALFSARTVHHVLLVAVAAPLFALAYPAPRPQLTALHFGLATAVLWLWHVPAAYDRALSDMAVYWLMQGSLLVTATVFWRAALGPGQPMGGALLWTLAAFMQMGLLGALLTFAPTALYAAHAAAPLDWGLTPLADQQLAGLAMWVPAGIPYAILMAVVARRDWRAATGAKT